MPTLNKIDDKNFESVATATTPYNVDDLYAQIDTLNQRIAQIILNGQERTQAEIQPSLNEIASLKALLDEATSAGLDTTPPVTLVDSAALVKAVDDLKNSAEVAATPVDEVVL